jgi:hypothetical protein
METLLEHNTNAVLETNENFNEINTTFHDRFDNIDGKVSHLSSTYTSNNQVLLMKVDNIAAKQDEFVDLTEQSLGDITEEIRYQKYEIIDSIHEQRRESKNLQADIRSIRSHVNVAKDEIVNKISKKINDLGNNMEYQFRSMYAIIKKNFMSISEEMTLKYIEIMKAISDNPGQTCDKLSELLDMNKKTLQRNLAVLRQNNILKSKKRN